MYDSLFQYIILLIKRLGAPLTPAFDCLTGSARRERMLPMSRILISLFCIIVLAALPACTLFNPPTVSSTPTQPQIIKPSQALFTLTSPPPTPLPATAMPTAVPIRVPSLTSVPTITLAPTFTFTPTSTKILLTPSSTKTLPSPTGAVKLQTVKIFLVALNDNGVSGKKIGCGDSLVAVDVKIAPTTGVLRASLEKLLSIKSDYYGDSGLYNALYRSTLSIDNLTIENGVARVLLKGSLYLGGVCDNPRVQNQLEAAALQFSTVSKVNIFINGVALESLLSLK
jgi:hypothetical protein